MIKTNKIICKTIMENLLTFLFLFSFLHYHHRDTRRVAQRSCRAYGRTILHPGYRQYKCSDISVLCLVYHPNLLVLCLPDIAFSICSTFYSSKSTNTSLVQVNTFTSLVSYMEYSRGLVQYILCIPYQKSTKRRAIAHVWQKISQNGL